MWQYTEPQIETKFFSPEYHFLELSKRHDFLFLNSFLQNMNKHKDSLQPWFSDKLPNYFRNKGQECIAFQHNEMYVATRKQLKSGIITTLTLFFPSFPFF